MRALPLIASLFTLAAHLPAAEPEIGVRWTFVTTQTPLAAGSITSGPIGSGGTPLTEETIGTPVFPQTGENGYMAFAGVLDSAQWTAALGRFQEEGAVALNTPKVSSRPGQKVVVLDLKEIPSQQLIGDLKLHAGPTPSIDPQKTTEVGYRLACTPTINKSGGIELDVKVELKKLMGFNETYLTNPDSDDGAASTPVADYPRLRQPTISLRELSTTVTAPDGSAVAFLLGQSKSDTSTYYKYVFLTPKLIE